MGPLLDLPLALHLFLAAFLPLVVYVLRPSFELELGTWMCGWHCFSWECSDGGARAPDACATVADVGICLVVSLFPHVSEVL